MALEAKGSNPFTHPCNNDGLVRVRVYIVTMCLTTIMNAESTGVSPSGKAQDFDSCIRQFESGYPSHLKKLDSELVDYALA